MNSLPKYVVSSTLQEPKWSNSTVLKGDVVKEASKLKQELDGDIVVYASTLFGETSDKKPMRLINIQTVGDGLAVLTYRPEVSGTT